MSNEQLITELQGESVIGLEAPPGADLWTSSQIRAFFESDGDVIPAPAHKPATSSNAPPMSAAAKAKMAAGGRNPPPMSAAAKAKLAGKTVTSPNAPPMSAAARAKMTAGNGTAPAPAPARPSQAQAPAGAPSEGTNFIPPPRNPNFTGDEFVRFEFGKGVAQVTLTRPQENNCLSAGMTIALGQIVDTLTVRTDIRLVFLCAEGRNFCAGGDPKGFQAAAAMTDADNLESAVHFAKFLHGMQTLPQFVVALVNGSCYGGGFGLVSVCDMVIAVKSARFTLSEVKLGVIPATISPYVVAKIGISNAKRLFCTAEAPQAILAKEYGLVNEVVDNATEFDSWKKKLMTQLQACAPNAVAASKRLVMGVANQAITEDLMRYTAGELAKVRSTDEAKAGMIAIQCTPPESPFWKTQEMSLP